MKWIATMFVLCVTLVSFASPTVYRDAPADRAIRQTSIIVSPPPVAGEETRCFGENGAAYPIHVVVTISYEGTTEVLDEFDLEGPMSIRYVYFWSWTIGGCYDFMATDANNETTVIGGAIG